MKAKLSLPLTIVITIILVGFAFYSLHQYDSKKYNQADIILPTTTQISPSKTVEQESSTQQDEILKQIVGEDITCDSETIKNGCRVDKMMGNYAKGIMPEGYWIAKKGEEWQVVVRGNGIPTCEEVDKYSVPKEIYGNCIEKSKDLRFNQ